MIETKKTIQGIANWSLPVVGYGRMITEPITKNGWHLVPLEQYVGSIPQLAIESVEQMKQAGVEIAGVIIACQVQQEPEPQKDFYEDILGKAAEASKAMMPVVKEVGKVVLKVTGVVCVALGIILLIGLAGACLSNDPVLIVVLSDHTWVEVMRWEE